LQKYGADKFLLGADVKEEKITITGWTQQTEIWIYDFIQQYIEKGITQLFCTDVAKDGALEGPSLELYKNIIQKFPGLYLLPAAALAA
jgi:phosphoribosylformimino-5-aminoimidazole carboxamide ribotide isomerase